MLPNKQRISMITGSRIQFEERYLQRGYSLEEVRECIVSVSDDQYTVTVDETHPAYPREPKPGFLQPQDKTASQTPPSTSGPGTELKKLLSKIGITATPNCSCNARARRMDEEESRHPGWCEAHLEEIVGWLREEATNRGLPFLDMAGRVLVRRAIRNARKTRSPCW